jgi:steroid delta-isomerase-like uncharacterized protein
MSEQDNLSIVRKEYDSLNHHDINIAAQYYADTIQGTDVSFPEPMNKEGLLKHHQNFLTAIPDAHFDMKDLVAQGDKVAASWVVRGTQTGPLQFPSGGSLPPTGKTIQMHGVTLYEIRNGLILREDLYYDQLAFLTQLEVLTPQDILSMMRH